MVNGFLKTDLQFNDIKIRGSMGKRVVRAVFVLMVGLVLLVSQQRAFAQDEGPPALQHLAFFTLGGAAGGVLLGVAIWMLDPLAPSADVRLNALSGMGGGSIVGFIFGLMQLNQQAVFPFQNQPVPNEFQQGRNSPSLMNPEFKEVRFAGKKDRPRKVPLFQLNYRF